MKSKDSALMWIPLWVDKWLWGSTRIELEPDERSVWVDLMALAAKDDGYIRANVGVPYAHQQLAGMLCVSVESLARTIQKCKRVGKLTESENETLFIVNWYVYKLSKRHHRRFEKDEE